MGQLAMGNGQWKHEQSKANRQLGPLNSWTAGWLDSFGNWALTKYQVGLDRNAERQCSILNLCSVWFVITMYVRCMGRDRGRGVAGCSSSFPHARPQNQKTRTQSHRSRVKAMPSTAIGAAVGVVEKAEVCCYQAVGASASACMGARLYGMQRCCYCCWCCAVAAFLPRPHAISVCG